MPPIDVRDLKPGDCLLYKPNGFYGRLIAFRTWHNISHCEMYIGEGRSVASRDGKGVAIYPWRNTELAWVLRPSDPLDWASFWKWFRTVNGQKYDWFGLLRFAWTGEIGPSTNDKQFCSEFLTRAYRALIGSQFMGAEDADAVGPGDFLKVASLRAVRIPATLQ